MAAEAGAPGAVAAAGAGAAATAAEPILVRLRRETAAAHERLEARLAIFEGLSTEAGRIALLRRFWALHAGAEEALGAPLSGIPALAFEERRRAGLLERGLRDLGTSPQRPPVRVAIGGPGEALGLLYVLEGSSLGGRIIARTMAKSGSPMTGLGFFEPYGHDTGRMWRSFLAVLDVEAAKGGPVVRDEIVAGAAYGFALAETSLCAP